MGGTVRCVISEFTIGSVGDVDFVVAESDEVQSQSATPNRGALEENRFELQIALRDGQSITQDAGQTRLAAATRLTKYSLVIEFEK